MEYTVPNHRGCIGCSENGFLIRGFQYSEDRARIHAVIDMGEHTEGWIGIPHGGIGMGAILELMQGLPNFPDDAQGCFPLNVNYRLGGARVKIGDAVDVTVSEVDRGAHAKILLHGQKDPYIEASVSYHTGSVELENHIRSYLPDNFRALERPIVTLPRYKRCLVCGNERTYPGLNREFHLVTNSSKRLVFSKVGFTQRDRDDFFWFRRGAFVHPLALIALLDETMGWGGFFIAGQGGVTVNLEVTFLRDVRIGEKMIFFGRPERKRGRNPRLMFFWSTGGIATVHSDGTFEIAAVASAQYFALPELTEQMKIHLLPSELTRQAFDLVAQ